MSSFSSCESAAPGLVQALLAVLTIVILCGLFNSHWASRSTLPLPPGPPGEFLIGHLRVVPKEDTAGAFARWAEEYGSDVIHVRTLGQSIVVLNSAQSARDLMDKRGANYSDRPRFTLLEVMGWGRTLTFMRYGKRWHMHRKTLQSSLSSSNVRQWQSYQEQEARRTAHSMIRSPESWEKTLRRFAVAIVLKVSYGIEVTDEEDPYVQIAGDAMYATGNGGAPGNSIVDIVPIARFLPGWLVRDWALQFARKWRWAIQRLHNVPFLAAEREILGGRTNEASNVHSASSQTGNEIPQCLAYQNNSIAHSLLRLYDSNRKLGKANSWTLDDIKGAAGAVFIAGADTTWATLVVFILNMVKNQDVQAKAQAHIDSVVGHRRLPSFTDRQKLPYIDCLINELYRWAPLAPLGIPHKTIKADSYREMLIPQGIAIVYANVRAMGRDERVYEDPERFYPERYQSIQDGGLGEPLPHGHFGFGRRSCVGRSLADNSIWIMIATLLATVNFRKMTDCDGLPIEPAVEFTNGGTCHPRHFECDIRARMPQN